MRIAGRLDHRESGSFSAVLRRRSFRGLSSIRASSPYNPAILFYA